ncbi:gp285 [Sphingomonas phage PAU]|uniref:gp285 n=1 Tax=Sphingomonas phage PAU TaxID=1150991 RepID=UPI000257349C|nr:gp285 [Sphingomonas phage PAU]AFF28283.1 gp285 [Sphingomonas phage PAU]
MNSHIKMIDFKDIIFNIKNIDSISEVKHNYGSINPESIRCNLKIYITLKGKSLTLCIESVLPYYGLSYSFISKDSKAKLDSMDMSENTISIETMSGLEVDSHNHLIIFEFMQNLRHEILTFVSNESNESLFSLNKIRNDLYIRLHENDSLYLNKNDNFVLNFITWSNS